MIAGKDGVKKFLASAPTSPCPPFVNRLPNVDRRRPRIKAQPNFKRRLIDWAPEDLPDDLRENGIKSCPEVARILNIDI